MKKYILFLFIFVFGLGLFNINANSAKAEGTSCVISVTLRAGSRGEQVVCLQTFLGLSADGRFGPRTKAAVVAFQRSNGLVADGVFGRKSRALWAAKGWGNPNSSVVISGVSGPQTLNVNQTGTWTVTASEKSGGTLSYFVVWGDEAHPVPMTSPSSSAMQQSATFTHSYATAGIYAPRFIVTNNITCINYPCPNSSASSSLSVNVVGATSTIVPKIVSLSTTTGAVGSQVTISGENFTATGNRIKFGDTNSENDPAYNLNSNQITCVRAPCYNTITFTVPSTYYVACLHSTPSCEVATRVVQYGSYDVSVINANGVSNTASFTVNSYSY